MNTQTLPKLPYAYNALEPFIDSQTMEIHHTKHHQAYIDKLNEAYTKHPEISEKPLTDLFMNMESVPEDVRMVIKNHGGGTWNHTFFWNNMTPEKSAPEGDLLTKLTESFESFDNFKKLFAQAGLARFGSGWVWVVLQKDGKFEIMSTPNQDNPIMENKAPVLGLDVWEHAYYLKYQNRRAEYIENWWNVVNWKQVSENLKNAAMHLD